MQQLWLQSSVTIPQVSAAIFFARSPDLIDSRKSSFAQQPLLWLASWEK